MINYSSDPRAKSIGIIGAGASALITAHTLLRDGFSSVQLLTRDGTPGGVWASKRVYPGLTINNVHGEFRFSCMEMPPPSAAGGRLTGGDMNSYMETFAKRFLSGRIRYNTEVLRIQRREAETGWIVHIEDVQTGVRSSLYFDRIVLCTGGCSAPRIPDEVSPVEARNAHFKGPVVHSAQFAANVKKVIAAAKASRAPQGGTIVIVGGGKSAQDISAYLAGQGVRVKVIFEKADAFLAVSKPLPDFIRKSRFLGVLSPHIELHTGLERFLHTTWLGSKLVHGIWNAISSSSYNAFKLPQDSPMRNTHSIFWGIRTNDEGCPRPNSFFSLVNEGKIELISPARVANFTDDGQGVQLTSCRSVKADAVILCTGYESSWQGIFDDETSESLGLARHAPSPSSLSKQDEWDYTSLANPPTAHPASTQWASNIYRGLVPAKNITKRDFAINGAVFTTNNGYTYEVSAHWISSYFLGDPFLLRNLPSTPEEAVARTERVAAWLRKRFPDMLMWTNESYSSGLAFWTWPQETDDLLRDMSLRCMRSGGNWLTWAFQVMDLKEIERLKEERDELRRHSRHVISGSPEDMC